jgi:DNA-binding LytR/AlgR family response regulator
VVFVTAHAQHALAAFDAGAIDYLLKPLSGGRLLQTIRRLQARGAGAGSVGARPSPALLQQVLAAPPAYLKWIKASTGNTLRLMLVDEIDYFQSEGKYTRVVGQGGEGLIRLSLKELLLQLNPAQFAQVHRSSIVNLHAVERIDKDGTAMAIRLKGGRGTLAVSEAYARQFRQM